MIYIQGGPEKLLLRQ